MADLNPEQQERIKRNAEEARKKAQEDKTNFKKGKGTVAALKPGKYNFRGIFSQKSTSRDDLDSNTASSANTDLEDLYPSNQGADQIVGGKNPLSSGNDQQKATINREQIRSRISTATNKDDLERIVDYLKNVFGRDPNLAEEIKNLVQERQEIIEKQTKQERTLSANQQENSGSVLFGKPADVEEKKKKVQEDQKETPPSPEKTLFDQVLEVLAPSTKTSTPDFFVEDVAIESRFTLPNDRDQNSEALEIYDEAFAAKQTVDSQTLTEYDSEFAKKKQQESNPQGHYYEEKIENRDLFSAEGKIRNNESFLSVAGLDQDATPEEAKKAYRKLALKYSQDKNLDRPDEAKLIFQEINEAYARYTSFLEVGNPVEENTPKKQITSGQEDIDALAKRVNEDPEAALKAALDAIKIDKDRSGIFSQAAELIKQDDQKGLSDLLKSAAGLEMAQKDTSFGKFADVASIVLDSDASLAGPQDKKELLEKLSKTFKYLGDNDVDPNNKEKESVELQIAIHKIGKIPEFEKLAKGQSIIPQAVSIEDPKQTEAKKDVVVDANADFNKKVEEDSKIKQEADLKGKKIEITDDSVKNVAIGTAATALALTACIMMPPFGIFIAGAIMYGASTQMSFKEKDKERDLNLREAEDLENTKTKKDAPAKAGQIAKETGVFIEEEEKDLNNIGKVLRNSDSALHQQDKELKQEEARKATQKSEEELKTATLPSKYAIEGLREIQESLKSSTTRAAEGVSDANTHLPSVTTSAGKGERES